MCAICGCNTHTEVIGTDNADLPDPVGSGAIPEPAETDHPLHFGTGAAGLSVPGLSAGRIIKLEADVLNANQQYADANRRHFAAHGVAVYNFLSSPGSGKTSVLCATITALRQRLPELPLAVIEGDQQTSLDAERIRASGTQAVQINTGRGCHLDARMIGQAFSRLDLHRHQHSATGAPGQTLEHSRLPVSAFRQTVPDRGHRHPLAQPLLFIENVGNLVCPALWDLGENAKVVILSVTEGDDKPLKYPDMFAAASLLLINKIDLLPYVEFDVERCAAYARRINPDITVLQLSATRGDGMDTWLDWLRVTTC